MAMRLDQEAYAEFLKGKNVDQRELAEHLRKVSAQTGPAISSATNAVYGPSFSALIDGKSLPFRSAAAKFDALAEAWERHNAGRSVRDYYHLAHMQIIGMSELAIPHLLQRMKRGDAKWVFALKCISGMEADTPDMLGDSERIIQAWLAWGEEYEWRRSGRYSRTDEEVDPAVLPEVKAG
jgi:hypothetical protein